MKNWCGRNEFLRELLCRESRMLQFKVSDMKTVLGDSKIHGVALGIYRSLKLKKSSK